MPCSHTSVAHDWSLQSQSKGSILVPIPHFLMSSQILPALVNFAPHEDKWSKYLLDRELCLHVAKGIPSRKKISLEQLSHDILYISFSILLE